MKSNRKLSLSVVNFGDVVGKGFITKDDLSNVFNRLMPHMPQHRIEAMFRFVLNSVSFTFNKISFRGLKRSLIVCIIYFVEKLTEIAMAE